MLGHETSLSKFKKTEIISSIFSDLEITYEEKKTTKNTNTWRINNMLKTTNGPLKISKKK